MPSSYTRPEVMLIKHSRSKKPFKIMDPDCAICNQPALAQCECEAKGLDIAVRQAEQRMMTSVFADIRYVHLIILFPISDTHMVCSSIYINTAPLTSPSAWVRGHAQDYILSYFSMLTTRRKEVHASTLRHLTERAATYYRARPHPSDISAADAELKRGIDDDWKASVQRYPEVLEYFYGLVDLNLPGDGDPGVRDPPLSALGGVGMGRERERKVRLREPTAVVEERRRRRRSRTGEREMIEDRGQRDRERMVRVPNVPMAGGGRERERERGYAPPSGYAYRMPGY